MKKKHVLLCCNRILNLGGIEKAFVSFLNTLDTNKYEVTIVLHDKSGTLFPELILDKINIFYVNSIDSAACLKEDIRHFRVVEVIKGLWNRMKLRCEKNWYARIMYTYRIINRQIVFPEHFDCAISFTTDYSDLAIALSVCADKRVAFVHGDATQNKRAAALNDKLLQKFDKIYAVSEQAKELFVCAHPKCKRAMDVMHNVIPVDEIRQKAMQSADGMLQDGLLTLCTVGRLSPEKGQQMIPAVAQLLGEVGWSFRWYLVGEGPLRADLEREIQSRGLQSQVILLGARQNPYPYMKNCDIYVQTSFSEAYCITIAEARSLLRPVITTDAPGIREQIIPGENGLIVESMTPEAIAAGINTLLKDADLRRWITQNLQNDIQTQVDPLGKLYNYIEM